MYLQRLDEFTFTGARAMISVNVLSAKSILEELTSNNQRLLRIWVGTHTVAAAFLYLEVLPPKRGDWWQSLRMI